ncbi:hypothetical protein L1887_38609 [Cichorium endivia]|nr:hypothetical protein L1887_38609 [Cichorium endivia]
MAELLNRFLQMVSHMFNHDLIAIHMLSLTLLLLNVDLLLLFLHIRFLLRLALLMMLSTQTTYSCSISEESCKKRKQIRSEAAD